MPFPFRNKGIFSIAPITPPVIETLSPKFSPSSVVESSSSSGGSEITPLKIF